MIELQQRAYSGKLFRPKPLVHKESDGSLIIVATPWGPRSSAEMAIRTIQDFVHSSREDTEVTSPFDYMDCISPLANLLRVAFKLTNDVLYGEENRNEYKSGIELLAIACTNDEWVIAQSGYPQIFLDRKGVNLTPIAATQDLALNYCQGARILPPLPQQLLGTTATSNSNVLSLKPASEDRLVLISRSTLPPEFYSLTRKERTLDNMAGGLARSDEDSPFWLGLLTHT